MKKKGIIVSGYFNPLHKGHIEYFDLAKSKGDLLIVIVNNDKQRNLKGSKEFMNQEERTFIVSKLKMVDKVYLSIDEDRTVIRTINKIYKELSDNMSLCFANGGDQSNDSSPESEICKKLGIQMIDNLGSKIQSSSWLLK
tara:strand:+ start:237 stop:656 length:420 start_codon:yes stop_codon:yes gene_type:complete